MNLLRNTLQNPFDQPSGFELLSEKLKISKYYYYYLPLEKNVKISCQFE